MNEVDEQVEPYIPPMLVDAGEFSEDTLGFGDTYIDVGGLFG